MTPEEFREAGRQAVDFIADYLQHIEELPVQSRCLPGDVRRQLPAAAPEDPESFEQILADVQRVIVPGLTHWQSPTFFGYFPANNSHASILGELMSAGFGVQGMLWATSPACTELETLVLDWLVSLLDLPTAFLSSGDGGGVIQDSASSADLMRLVAARDRATSGAARSEGVLRPLTIYASQDAHSSVEKAAMIAGIGSENVRKIETDAQFRLCPDRLRRRIEQDVQAGRKPCLVVSTIGTTACGAVDPTMAMAEIASHYNAWLHVDAAMAGSAAICPEFRDIHEGLSGADSYCFNPHKWLLVNFDCDCFYVRRHNELIRSLSVLPEYLRNQASEAGAVIDYRDWQVPLGRRFRALKLWFVLRMYGAEGLRRMIRRHVTLAREFADWIAQSQSFELAAQPQLNLVCFRHRLGDDATRTIQNDVNSRGRMFLTHASIDGRYTLRMSIGQGNTHRRHIELAWEQLNAAAERLETYTSH